MYINVANKYPVGGWGDVTDEGNDEGDVILHIIADGFCRVACIYYDLRRFSIQMHAACKVCKPKNIIIMKYGTGLSAIQ